MKRNRIKNIVVAAAPIMEAVDGRVVPPVPPVPPDPLAVLKLVAPLESRVVNVVDVVGA